MSYYWNDVVERLSEATKRRMKAKAQRKAGEFIRPIPKPWIIAAAQAPGSKTLAVGLALWFLSGLEQNRTFRLRSSIVREFSVCRSTCYRALAALEAAGLITVERSQGRGPKITILEAKNVAHEDAG